MHNAVHQREEAPFIMRFAGGEGHCPHGSAVECAQETDELGTLGMVSCEFNSCFDAFCSRVGHKRRSRTVEGCNFIQLLAKLDPGFMIEVG